MKVQFENKVMSSLLMFVDHKVTQKGDAYTNTKSNFYNHILPHIIHNLF